MIVAMFLRMLLPIWKLLYHRYGFCPLLCENYCVLNGCPSIAYIYIMDILIYAMVYFPIFRPLRSDFSMNKKTPKRYSRLLTLAISNYWPQTVEQLEPYLRPKVCYTAHIFCTVMGHPPYTIVTQWLGLLWLLS